MQGELNLEDALYPSLLKQIPNPPKKLYYKGNLSLEIFTNCLAVVGSRKMSIYGKRVVETFISEMSPSDLTIVSGFMYGIDATAHKAALKAAMKTIAILGCGVDQIYPSSHEDLYNSIIDNGGLLLSEFPFGIKPTNWTFAKRNRIIAGLSSSVLVVEAGDRSGSLITAYWANKYKRNLFSVPGDIFSDSHLGTNKLLYEGAKIGISSSVILESFGISNAKVRNVPALNGEFTKVFNLIKQKPVSIDILIEETHLSAEQISSIVTQLELDNLIITSGGYLYANKA